MSDYPTKQQQSAISCPYQQWSAASPLLSVRHSQYGGCHHPGGVNVITAYIWTTGPWQATTNNYWPFIS